MNPQDMAHIKVMADELVQIYNDNGLNQAMVYPTTRRGERKLDSMQGKVVSSAMNELIIAYYKQVLQAIGCTARRGQLSFKSLDHAVG